MTTRISLSSDVYTVQRNDDKGQKLYYNFEKVTKDNYYFWYRLFAENMARYCKAFCQTVTENNYPTYPNKFSEGFNYNQEQYQKVVEFIQRKKYYEKKPFSGVRAGIAGMSQVLSSFCLNRKVFMVYASHVPIEKPHINDEEINISNGKDYHTFFGHIIMSFVFITNDTAPTVTHYGIFRNPVSFLDPEEKYRGLSMKLHGFGAIVALTHFRNKKYMITSPLPSMIQIFVKYLGRNALHLGTNMDLKNFEKKSKEDRELLENYPPIFHLGRDGKNKIAKEGVNLSEYLESLPDEKAEFIAAPKNQINFSGFSFQALTTLLNLTNLAELFLEKSGNSRIES